MAQARFPALLTAAIVVLSATSVRAQDNVEVLDEKSSDVPEESSESSDSSDDDDGGWSEDDYDDEPSGSSAPDSKIVRPAPSRTVRWIQARREG